MKFKRNGYIRNRELERGNAMTIETGPTYAEFLKVAAAKQPSPLTREAFEFVRGLLPGIPARLTDELAKHATRTNKDGRDMAGLSLGLIGMQAKKLGIEVRVRRVGNEWWACRMLTDRAQ